VLDVAEIAWPLEVRHAAGDEDYLTFGGETEHPAPGEVIFADHEGQAHARRWTNRQSGRSAVRATTSTVLIVAEALHATAAGDIADLVATLTAEISETWQAKPRTAVLAAADPSFPLTLEGQQLRRPSRQGQRLHQP
jgi:DNA/RNA-binding domain of Phe-tRNA-synthetase-like protein